MKFACISDTHNQLSNVVWPSADVLLHAGDATMSGNIKELAKFNKDIGDAPYDIRVAIAGNHDWLFQRDPNTARGLVTNYTYLEDSGIVITSDKEVLPWRGESVDGIKIWGSPWQPWFCDWAFNLPRGSKLRAKWDLIPEGTDILITHGPPFGFGDMTTGIYSPPEKVGCEDLLKRIQAIKPKYHIFGHIHSAHGIEKDEHTIYINASTCDENYDPIQRAETFEL